MFSANSWLWESWLLKIQIRHAGYHQETNQVVTAEDSYPSTSHVPTAACSEVSITLAAIDMRKSKGSWTWTPTPMMMGLSYSFLEPHLERIPLSQKNRCKMLQVISGKLMETKANRSVIAKKKHYQLIRHTPCSKFGDFLKGHSAEFVLPYGLSRMCSSEGLQFSPSQSAWPKQWCWKGSPPGFSRRSKHEFWGTKHSTAHYMVLCFT